MSVYNGVCCMYECIFNGVCMSMCRKVYVLTLGMIGISMVWPRK